jgi:hypothetical protein
VSSCSSRHEQAYKYVLDNSTNTGRNPKRQREDDSDDETQDESRYSPRAKWEERRESARDPISPSPPTKKSVDKGKKKASGEIGDMMNQGHAEGSRSTGQHDLVATLPQKDIEDMPVRELRQRVQNDSQRSKGKAASRQNQTQVKRRTTRTSKAPL